MQKFCISTLTLAKSGCRAIFPPNSLKDQQQMDNAKFRISSLTLTKSGRKNSAEPFSR